MLVSLLSFVARRLDWQYGINSLNFKYSKTIKQEIYKGKTVVTYFLTKEGKKNL